MATTHNDNEFSVSEEGGIRCSHDICRCPLRLNQLSATTTTMATTTFFTKRNIRKHSHITDNPSSLDSNNKPTMSNICSENQKVRPSNTKVNRRRYCGNDRCSANILQSHYYPISLLVLGITCCLVTLDRFSAAAVADIAPVFGNPSTSSAVAHFTGPSLCPLVPGCHCKWTAGKQTAICSRRNLATIPDNLLPETQILDLSGNPLTQLVSRVFQDKHLTNLQKIHLSECRISYIADDAFAQLGNLIELDLSHNNIQHVPSRAFWPMKSSLRRLSLAYNPIQSVEPEAFSMLDKLITLDMTSCQLNTLKPSAFHKLDQLKELKLADNNLTQLPLSVVSGLRTEYSMLDLFGNPWHCDCELRQSMDYMRRHNMQLPIEPTCTTPQKFKDQRWISIKAEEFFCPPSVINRHTELTVGAGSNVSLACSARGTPPLTFIWFQDEKNLTTGRANSSEPPASTKLLEEKRYEIAEEISPSGYGQPNVTTSILYLYDLKITDTSLFLCWVDNIAGSSFANFSLTVNDSPPTPAAGSASSASSLLWRSLAQTETQVAAVIIGFVILLAALIMLLLLVKHNNNNNNSSGKNSHSSDPKSQAKSNGSTGGAGGNLPGVISSANKFSHHRSRNSMLTDSSDQSDTGADSDGEQNSTSSGSSCRKAAKVMDAGELNGFIEHMRSGIINMDYHAMSPVIQFNNTLKNNNNVANNHFKQQQQQHLQQPYLDTTAMHHFPSASNASSIPYYGAGGNRSASMATTTSDLSPSSGSMNANFATTIAGQQPTNCDLQRHHQMADNHQHPNITNNNASASYTSDYQSGYEENAQALANHQHRLQHHHAHQMMYDPLMAEFQQQPQHAFNPANGHLYQQAPLVDTNIRPQSMLYNPSTLDHLQQEHQQYHHQQQDDLVLQNMIQNNGRLSRQQQSNQHQSNHQLHIL